MARALELDYQRAPYTRRAPARPPAAQQPAGGAAPLGSAADVTQLTQRTAPAREGKAQATVLAMAPTVSAGGGPEAREPAGMRAPAAGVCRVCDAAALRPSGLDPGVGAWPRGSNSAVLPGPRLGAEDGYTAVAPLMRDTAAAVACCAGLLPGGGSDARMPTRVQLEALGAPQKLLTPGIMLALNIGVNSHQRLNQHVACQVLVCIFPVHGDSCSDCTCQFVFCCPNNLVSGQCSWQRNAPSKCLCTPGPNDEMYVRGSLWRYGLCFSECAVRKAAGDPAVAEAMLR